MLKTVSLLGALYLAGWYIVKGINADEIFLLAATAIIVSELALVLFLRPPAREVSVLIILFSVVLTFFVPFGVWSATSFLLYVISVMVLVFLAEDEV